ncbi:MAG: SiaB family protein kinase, partial [Bacteroidales bacterium]
IHNKMISERLMFVYRGEITEDNSLPLITLLENEMKDDSYGSAGRKRLFMYVLESLQNIAKHGEHQKHAGMSVVAYSKAGDGYTITTGNIISVGHVENLKKRLEDVNKLGPEETKALYRQILGTSGFSEMGGAGLGLIEMAVKTGNKLDFGFLPVDEDFSYFILSKTVDANGMGMNSGEDNKQFQSGAFMELANLMAGNGIHLIWSGQISQDIGDGVLSLTETALSEEDVAAKMRRRIFGIMVELLENISKYNPGREPGEKYGMPVAMVRIEDQKFLISTGNLIHNMNIRNLRGKLDNINSYDRSELKDLFFKSLSVQTVESDSTGNMGLIAVARKAGSKLNYRFEPVNELFSYFMLAVKVEDLPG